MPDTPTQHASARLLAILSVDPSRRVICREPGCGHGVYAAIHVVQDKENLLVLGSTCFANRYGGASAFGSPAYSAGSGGGSQLTEEERQTLVANTAELIAQFKARHEAVMAAANAKVLALRQRMQQQAQATSALFNRAPTRPAIQPPAEHPWPWQHPNNTSVAVVRGPDSQCWVRVMHRSGTQMLVPWPAFDGWDETLPPTSAIPTSNFRPMPCPTSLPPCIGCASAATKPRKSAAGPKFKNYSQPPVEPWHKRRQRRYNVRTNAIKLCLLRNPS